jgi:hypothetical protein
VKTNRLRILIIAICLLIVPALVHAFPFPFPFIPYHFPPPPNPNGAPELDASLMANGIAFLGAGLMLVTERFRKRSK